jgi:hypothetical protein
VTFDDLWIQSGRLSAGTAPHRWEELSAGQWREKLFESSEQYPAVQPQHERRKYLLQSSAGDGSPATLFSYFGLGQAVKPKLCRAERLAEAGFTPSPERVVHGFIVRGFILGTLVRPGEADQRLLDTLARYLDHLYREHRTESSVSDETLREMTSLNVAEGLGGDWAERLRSRLPGRMESWGEHAVALDARMQAHEWIHTDVGYMKADAFDHHNDHFFPGCQDVAWDVAGAVIELDLNGVARRFLLERFRSLSGDRTIGSRLPHYSLAYLAFRLGYCRLAASVLDDDPDTLRFAAAAERYADLLRRELGRSPGAFWNA